MHLFTDSHKKDIIKHHFSRVLAMQETTYSTVAFLMFDKTELSVICNLVCYWIKNDLFVTRVQLSLLAWPIELVFAEFPEVQFHLNTLKGVLVGQVKD